jgi:hypothetical protein
MVLTAASGMTDAVFGTPEEKTAVMERVESARADRERRYREEEGHDGDCVTVEPGEPEDPVQPVVERAAKARSDERRSPRGTAHRQPDA